MFGSGILEMVVGLVFVFLLVSMLVTVINELIAAMLLSRAKWLRIGIERLLNSEWAQKLYDHPPIDGAVASGKGPGRIRGAGPSYIASRSFANVIFDLLRQHSDTESLSKIQQRFQEALNRAAGDGVLEGMKAEIDAVNQAFADNRMARAATADLARILPQLQARIDASANAAASDANAGKARAPYTARNAMADVQRFIDAMPMRYVREMIADVPNERLRKTLLVLLDDAQSDVEKFKQNVEIWFNNAMDRVGGWYKRRSQVVGLVVSLVTVVSLNVDSIVIVKHLQTSPGVRDALVAQARILSAAPPASLVGTGGSSAESTAAAASADPSKPLTSNASLRLAGSSGGGASTDPLAQFEAVESQLNQLSLPMGWVKQATTQTERDAMLELPGRTVGWGEVIKFHLLGWLITVLAATLGAPFWFDTLNRIMSIRSTGKAPEEMPKPPKEVPLPLEPGQTPADAVVHAR